MLGPDYGMMGLSFRAARILQSCCFIASIGILANFISLYNEAGATPWLGTIVGLIACCAGAIYTAITLVLFIDDILHFTWCIFFDAIFLIVSTVGAIGTGLSWADVNCRAVGTGSVNTSGTAYDFSTALGSGVGARSVNLTQSTNTSRSGCYQAKATWALYIALAFLFLFSVVCNICLRQRVGQPSREKPSWA